MVKSSQGGSIVEATKVANIQVATTYPIVSAYEFEFLKAEEVIRERLDGCTVYLIVQRPLTYFDNVELRHGYIYFDIVDDEAPPLHCRVNLVAAEICGPNETVDIEMQFFAKTPSRSSPYRGVGALKLFKEDGSFILWWSPQKILYEMLVNELAVEVEENGNPLAFLDFKLHYIGRAFSQKVWDRLTGHEKMQRILTLQGPIGASPEARAPFEISLILLNIVGLTDVPELPYMGFTGRPGQRPTLHKVDLEDDEAFSRFMTQPLAPLGDEALTREVEAFLIQQFQPEYNAVKFAAYPNIKGGMRSKGYTWTELSIELLPAFLHTDHFSMLPILGVANESATKNLNGDDQL